MVKKNYCGWLMFALIAFLSVATVLSAQSDACFIYGKITTISDNEYVGAIRWSDDEEVYWTDHFNSTKSDNDFLNELSRQDRRELDRNGSHFEILGLRLRTYTSSHSHTFACQFGDIKSIEVRGRQRIELELKNGEIYDLDGGSNDIGSKIRIMDVELGEIVLRWGRIEKIEFMKTPAKLDLKFGSPLYGVVETYYGDFNGLIQWDHDERVSVDVLDGDNEDGDISIPFGKIHSIEKKRRGCIVKLNSGRELYLTGSNDVNSENKGIIVSVPGMGRVDVKWRDFKKVTFDSKAVDLKCSYDLFKTPDYIRGTVVTSEGQKISGQIIYDIDEFIDIEFLDGDDDDMKYMIPFRNIKSIRPKNYNYSVVTLKNGQELLLGERQDVSDKNDGILIMKNGRKKDYIRWEDVREIILK